MLCPLCRGSGSLVAFPKGCPQWWECQSCGGTGVTVQHGPATFDQPRKDPRDDE